MIHSLHCMSSSDRIDVFHHLMFHGITARDEPGKPQHWIGDDLSEPLELVRNIWRIPDLFKPAGSVNLVVSSAVKSELDQFPNIQFKHVEFKKRIYFPFHAGDYTYAADPVFGGKQSACYDEQFLRDLPDAPESKVRIGPYFEVILPRFREFVTRFSGTKKTPFRASELSSDVVLELSEELIDQHPIFWLGSHFFNQRAFALIGKYIDWDYFQRTMINM
jgi:hypothetical protein